MTLYGIPQCTDKKTALAAAIAYWVFRCRDRQRSPAKGVDTWTFFQSSIVNSAINAQAIEDFIETLCKKLVVPHLRPKEWTNVIRPNQVIQRVNADTGEIMELNQDQGKDELIFESWRSILNSLASEGITDRKILKEIQSKPHIIITFVRVRFEEDRAIGQDNIEELDAIEVEVNDYEN